MHKNPGELLKLQRALKNLDGNSNKEKEEKEEKERKEQEKRSK